MKLYYLKSCSNLKTPIIYMLWNCFRIWELTRRENNADTSAAITCAIHHLVLRFHSYYLPLCQSYLCNRGNSAHFYSELFSIKNYIIDVISHGYFKSINSTQDGNIFFSGTKISEWRVADFYARIWSNQAHSRFLLKLSKRQLY